MVDSKALALLHQIRINSKNYYLVGLGNQKHYERAIDLVSKNKTNLKNLRFWLYDKSLLDVAFHLSESQQKKCLYISTQHFEVIELSEGVDQAKFPSLEEIVENNCLSIKKNCLDIHPFDAYRKLCQFAQFPYEPKYVDLFRENPCFSNFVDMKIQSPFLPYLKTINQEYLSQEGLKLRIRERLKVASEYQAKQIVERWSKQYQIDRVLESQLIRYGQKQQEKKIKWMCENKFGFEVPPAMITQKFGLDFNHSFIE